VEIDDSPARVQNRVREKWKVDRGRGGDESAALIDYVRAFEYVGTLHWYGVSSHDEVVS
jgi:hypothetical protein